MPQGEAEASPEGSSQVQEATGGRRSRSPGTGGRTSKRGRGGRGGVVRKGPRSKYRGVTWQPWAGSPSGERWTANLMHEGEVRPTRRLIKLEVRIMGSSQGKGNMDKYRGVTWRP